MRGTQPASELVFGAPLQLREANDEIVVEVRGQYGQKIELKRFDNHP